jgi:hypothetical protein
MSLLLDRASCVVSAFLSNDNSPKGLGLEDRRRLCLLSSSLLLQEFILC